MSRLGAALRLDARLQARNHVYAIICVVALALAGTLRALFTPEQLHFFMPLIALAGVGASAFILVGILVMLERDEGTLDVVLVSPLRSGEYLGSKLMTVSALAVVEGALIVAIAYGSGFSPGLLVCAVLLRALLVSAVGIAIGVRYRSITRFLLPVALLTLAFDLPVIWYLELWPSPVFYLWPTLPSLILAKAAFLPVEAAQLWYAGGYGVVAATGAVLWALRSLDRFVVRGGVRS